MLEPIIGQSTETQLSAQSTNTTAANQLSAGKYPLYTDQFQLFFRNPNTGEGRLPPEGLQQSAATAFEAYLRRIQVLRIAHTKRQPRCWRDDAIELSTDEERETHSLDQIEMRIPRTKPLHFRASF